MRPGPLRNAGRCPARTVTAIGRRRLMQALPALAALALTTAARAGLLHMTDLRADPERRIHSEVADAVEPPFVYAAVVTTLARRPGPAAFVDFLMAAQGSVLLAAHGLEKASS